ncbi:TPA: RnfH family protein [Stenotrophomonas maltophilia]|nr:RnfH family protein [Stenotrophomonas maltophilia]
MIEVEVVLAWPQQVLSRRLQLEEGATVAEAIVAAALEGSAGCPAVAVAVHGVLARPQQVLLDGDRIELLRPLLADPKDNRRRRALGG